MESAAPNNDQNNVEENHEDDDVDNDQDGEEDRKLSPDELAILELMKQQALSQNQDLAAAVATATVSSSSTNKKKKNSKKKKKAGAAVEAVASVSQLPAELQQLQLAEPVGGSDREKTHAFWNTQPMPHTGTEHPEGPIQPNKSAEEIRDTPYNMPNGFAWSNVDITDATQRTELYDLLANNYVEDDECLFRFDYSSDFLLWALTPPEFNPDFLLGVRTTSTASSSPSKLVAFISGIPTTIQAYDQKIQVVEINFLCVHKKLRSKRLAPVLIKEITRRVNISGIFQAVYTAGVVLPVPVSAARYHHRSLNPKKLVRVGFSQLHPRMTLARMQKLYKLPPNVQTTALRPMEPEDVPGVHALLTTYLSKFQLKVLFTPEEVAHWLLPRDKVINSFVVEAKHEEDGDGDTNNKTKKITDLVSFYHLPSSILGHDDTLFAAYSFYNVATTIPLVDLMRDALILARNSGSDVFNALTLMENNEFLTELKFGKGDGNLQYYIYNWACPRMEPENVGIVLL